MRELTYVSPGVLEWRDVPEPAITDVRDALVRPIAVATCDLDAAIVAGATPVTGPVPFGHEAVAEVIEVGGAVPGVQRGDRVVVPFQISCGACAACHEDRTASCRTVPRGSAYGLGVLGGVAWGGMLSDLVRVPFADAMLVPLPAGVAPATLASAADNIPDAWRSVAPHLAAQPGAEVLIVGGGAASIPLYAVDIARALGAGAVHYLDTDPARLALAEALGAKVTAGPPPPRAGSYPITVDASADVAGLACAIRSTAADGVCTSVAIYFRERTPVPLLEMYTKGITFITGRVHARALLPEVLALVAGGRIHPERVTKAIVPWEDAPRVLATHGGKHVVVR